MTTDARLNYTYEEIEVANNLSDVTLEDLPEEMRFGEGHMVSIVTYSVLMVISGCGNLMVLSALLRRRKQKKSLVNLMLMHLATADLVVTFVMMPLEIAWAATVSWWAGDVLCRVLSFFRIFGLFLSSFVLVCISVDRYFAVLHPMGVHDAYRRGKIMLAVAWLMSTMCSLPQMIVFHVEHHNVFTWYEQCVSFNSFPSRVHELIYYMFGMIAMYGLPLIVIITSYSAILVEISRKSREGTEQIHSAADDVKLRRSGIGNFGRAKQRTLKMTVIIVIVFILCWTPYYTMCLWYWFDQESAKKIDPRIQRALFLFASSNSCMNPIVYGIFSLNCVRSCTDSRKRHRTKRHRESRNWSEHTVLDNSVVTEIDSHYENNWTYRPSKRSVNFPFLFTREEKCS